MNISGLNLSKPLILQLSNELSKFTVLDVDNIQSYLDLNKCTIFLEISFVIHFFLLLIEKKSFEIAMFAEINGMFNFLLIKKLL